MPSEGIPPALERKLRQAAESAALEDYPNPERIGCPRDQRTLRALAAKKLAPDDPVIQHVAECSPCLREVTHYRLQERRSSWQLASAIAALVLLAVALFFYRSRSSTPTTTKVLLTAVLDSRPQLVMQRGASDPATQVHAPVAIGRGEVKLSILLPVDGSNDTYEFQLLDHLLQPVLRGSSQATVQNGVPTVLASLDTSSLSAGSYSFRLRHNSQDWQTYAVIIQ